MDNILIFSIVGIILLIIVIFLFMKNKYIFYIVKLIKYLIKSKNI